MQNEDKNHTSNINVFPVLHTIFFLLGCVRGGGGGGGGGSKNGLVYPAGGNKMHFMTQ